MNVTCRRDEAGHGVRHREAVVAEASRVLAPGGEPPQHGDLRRNQTGLSILGQVKPCVVRKTNGGHVPLQGVCGLLKGPAAFRHLLEKIPAHPGPLTALAGKDCGTSPCVTQTRFLPLFEGDFLFKSCLNQALLSINHASAVGLPTNRA